MRKSTIHINLDYIETGLQLIIDEQSDNTLFVTEDASENGEAKHQLLEGCRYDFELSNEDYSLSRDQIVQVHKREKHRGSIAPNIYVGTLQLLVEKDDKQVGSVAVEVRSIKSDYRNDYRNMLELITEKCTDLLLQANSPVSHNFAPDYSNNEEGKRAMYQRFAFVKSVISTEEFSEAMHRIISAPVTQWKETHEQKDIRNIRRFANSNVKELIRGSNRSPLPDNHLLQNYGLNSVPNKISASRKTDTVDTPENRFIKFALETFMFFCSTIHQKADKDSRLSKESHLLEQRLESYLSHAIFKEISHPNTLKLNSPILQRKEGYREVLRVWLMFDLAAKLVWKGGEDVYSGGKKDIATLYEYWLFFKLLDLFKSIFDMAPKDVSELIKVTKDGLNLQLKQGRFTALKGMHTTKSRKLKIKFNYNRSFSGQKEYPSAGSWTITMRPDYTLSFWPADISEKEAEDKELIVHIHFDAKYKIANLWESIEKQDETFLDEEKQENRKGIYKNADLLKMHAYKDAIRRTGGAYVLYPGDKSVKRRGFHEVMPGLGAFPVRPSKTDDGTEDLKNFILEVINHFNNRASQRENIASKTYEVVKGGINKTLNEPIPEFLNDKKLIPDETFVLVGFSKSNAHLKWYEEHLKYNFRMNDEKGSLLFTPEVVNAKFLLIRESGKSQASNIYKLKPGVKVYSKQSLEDLNHPSASKDNYLVYQIEKEAEELKVFNEIKWNFKELDKYKEVVEGKNIRSAAGEPFVVTLSELMRVKAIK